MDIAHRLRPCSAHFVRFALIENEHRTRQAIRGIRDLLKKDGVEVRSAEAS